MAVARLVLLPNLPNFTTENCQKFIYFKWQNAPIGGVESSLARCNQKDFEDGSILVEKL
jgi:hypothetical protein